MTVFYVLWTSMLFFTSLFIAAEASAVIEIKNELNGVLKTIKKIAVKHLEKE